MPFICVNPPLLNILKFSGGKRDAEDRFLPRSIDADDADVDAKSSDERFVVSAY